MSLLDSVKKENGNEVAAPTTTAKSAGANYQAKQKQKIFEAGKTVEAALKRGKVELTEDEKAAIALLTRVPGSGGNSFGTPIIFKIFGDTPKVGQTVPAIEIFEKTNKGFAEMRSFIKKWAEAGTVVAYDEKARSYKIEALGTLPALGK